MTLNYTLKFKFCYMMLGYGYAIQYKIPSIQSLDIAQEMSTFSLDIDLFIPLHRVINQAT